MSSARMASLVGRFKAALEEVSAISAKAEEANRDLDDSDRATITAKMAEARQIKADIDLLKSASDFEASVDALGLDDIGGLGPAKGLALGADGRPAKSEGSLGERFLGDEELASWLKSAGAMQSGRMGHSPAVKFRGAKDLLTGSDAEGSAGVLVRPDWRGLIDDGGLFQRILTIRNLVTNGTTGGDTVEYARVTGFTNGAAPVPEATGTSAGTASGDVAGRKPESQLTLERDTAPVRTIAHWLPATRRALSDAAQIRTLVDNFLRYGLEEELEDQMLNGDNTGEDFKGLLSGLYSGMQAQAWDTNLLVTTRKARTKVRVNGKTTPTAYVLNPADNERIDLLRDGSGGNENSGGFLFGGPAGLGVQTLWGLPRIESEAIPEGVGMVANWRQAVLWDREQAAIMVSDSHEDFFVRNLVAILAELRAAFGVMRSPAFCTIDLTAGS